jgi:hypothetical protein
LTFRLPAQKSALSQAGRLAAYATIGKRGALALVPAPDTSLELADRLLNLGKDGRPAKAFLSIDDARQWLAAQPEAQDHNQNTAAQEA